NRCPRARSSGSLEERFFAFAVRSDQRPAEAAARTRRRPPLLQPGCCNYCSSRLPPQPPPTDSLTSRPADDTCQVLLLLLQEGVNWTGRMFQQISGGQTPFDPRAQTCFSTSEKF